VNRPFGTRSAMPALGLALCLTAIGAPAAFAAGPPSENVIVGQPPDDNETNDRSAEEQARYAEKLAVADAIGADVEAQAAQPAAGDLTAMMALPPCDFGCAPTKKILETYARQQATSYYCGPASAQVAINYSRGYFYAKKGGERTDTNWKPQSKIAEWAGTTSSSGTSGANLEDALNRSNAILRPTSSWIYAYASTGDLGALHDKVVTDIHYYGMPLIIPVRPHQPDKPYHLESWPVAIAAWHWILIRGYNGLGPEDATLYYNDSAKGYYGGTGAYADTALTLWKVNRYSSDMIIW